MRGRLALPLVLSLAFHGLLLAWSAGREPPPRQAVVEIEYVVKPSAGAEAGDEGEAGASPGEAPGVPGGSTRPSRRSSAPSPAVPKGTPKRSEAQTPRESPAPEPNRPEEEVVQAPEELRPVSSEAEEPLSPEAVVAKPADAVAEKEPRLPPDVAAGKEPPDPVEAVAERASSRPFGDAGATDEDAAERGGASGPLTGSGGPGAGEGSGAGRGEAGRGSGSGSSFGAGSGGGDPHAVLVAHLRAHAKRCYPPLARRRSIQGTVGLSFCIDSHGMPQALRVEESSGSSLLDKAARECVIEGAAPLPGPEGCVRLDLPFRLE